MRTGQEPKTWVSPTWKAPAERRPGEIGGVGFAVFVGEFETEHAGLNLELLAGGIGARGVGKGGLQLHGKGFVVMFGLAGGEGHGLRGLEGDGEDLERLRKDGRILD